MREFLEIFNLGMILPETLTTISHISRSPRYGYGYKEKPGADLAFIKLFRTYRKIVIPGNPRSRGKREFLPQLGRQWHGSPLEGPVMVGIFFSMPVPKGTRMGRRMKMLRHQISHTRPPSLDRLIDFTLDCMNGIIFSDRSQIIRFHAEKEYRWNPEIRIFVRALSK
jgi:Holliday junction resolvase RusA-like endonuclease